MVAVSALWILCLASDSKVVLYVCLINAYLPNRICVPLLPDLSSLPLSSFFGLYPLEIKNCKYKYKFNMIISSTKILKFLDLKKCSFQKRIGNTMRPSNSLHTHCECRKYIKKRKCIKKFLFHHNNVNCNCNTDPPHRSPPPTCCHKHLQKTSPGGPTPPGPLRGPPAGL